MEIKDIDFKDVKNWSFNELDNAINSRKKDIEKLEGDIRKLREVKWQKTCEEMKSKVVDSGFDFSPELLQQFFLKSTEAEAESKPAKPKSKSSRSKKDTEKSEDKDADDDAHSADDSSEISASENLSEKNSTPSETASENSTPEEKLAIEEANVPNENLQSKLTAEKIAAEDTNVPAEIPEPETTSEEISNPNVAEKKIETGSSVSPTATEIGKQNFDVTSDALNNPADELFEEPTSQTISTPKELQTIARNVGLPADASFAEVRRAFDEKRYEIPPSIANNFAELLSKLERGEIA